MNDATVIGSSTWTSGGWRINYVTPRAPTRAIITIAIIAVGRIASGGRLDVIPPHPHPFSHQRGCIRSERDFRVRFSNYFLLVVCTGRRAVMTNRIRRSKCPSPRVSESVHVPFVMKKNKVVVSFFFFFDILKIATKALLCSNDFDTTTVLNISNLAVNPILPGSFLGL